MKISKKWRVVAVLILIIGLGGYIFTHYYFDVWLTRNVNDILNKSPTRKFDIDIRQLSVNISQREVVFDELEVIPNNENDGSALEVSVDNILIGGVKLWVLLVNKEFDAEEIFIVKPEVKVRQGEEPVKKSGKPLNEFLSEVLHSIAVKNVELQNASVEIIRSDQPIMGVRNFNLDIDGLYLDEAVMNHLVPYRHDILKVRIEETYFYLGQAHKLSIGDLKYESDRSKDLDVAKIDLRVIPSREEASARIGEQKDWITIALDSIEVRDFVIDDPNGEEPSFRFGRMTISDGEIHDFRDKNLPLKNFDEKMLFTNMIKAVPVVFTIDTLELQRVDIIYEEKAPEKTETGSLLFADSYASLFNITNNNASIEAKPQLSLDISSHLMRKADVAIHISMPYRSADQAFSVSGFVDPFALDELNDVIVPMVGVAVKNGQLDSLRFSFDADVSSATGTVDMVYHDLSIEVINEHSKNAGIKSFLGNRLIRTTNNPTRNNYILGQIQIDRDSTKGPFNLMWKALKNGMMKSAVPLMDRKSRREVRREERQEKSPA